MPIFHDPDLLFVHIPKNAGRSVERALLQGHDTPDGGRRSVPNRAARWLLKRSAADLPRTHLIGSLDAVFAAQHMTYAEMEMMRLLPGQTPGTRAMEAFCIVRNPFDRAVSSVGHFHPAGAAPTDRDGFERALAQWLDAEPADHNEHAHRRPQFDYVLDMRGNRVVETVIRYENLAAEFAALMARHGRSDLELPWQGKAKRSRDHRDYFNDAARRRVEEAFGEDIEAFGYGF